MKWEEVVLMAANVTSSDAKVESDCRVVRSIFRDVDLVAIITENYKALGVMKKPIKRLAIEFVTALQKGACEVCSFHTYDKDIGTFTDHCYRVLSMHSSSGHDQVRRWAVLADKMKGMEGFADLICRVCHKYTSFEGVLRTSLSWTLSECNRLGHPCMPYSAAVASACRQ